MSAWPIDLSKSDRRPVGRRLAVHKAADAEQRIVVGVVLVPEERDLQGDIYSHEEVERAAHEYLAAYRRAERTPHKDQHSRQVGEGEISLLESYIAPADFTLGEQRIKRGSWVMAWRIESPSMWADVKAGRRTGFSIGGTAKARPG